MANQFGYNQQYTDKPGMWDVDGYAKVVDGYGNLEVYTNQLTSKGTLELVAASAPSSIIQSITQTANSSGIYDVFFKQNWVQLTHASFVTVIPTGESPLNLVCQVRGDTVGQSGFGPGESALQSVRFTTIVPNTGSAGVLSSKSGLLFRIRLKNSSA